MCEYSTRYVYELPLSKNGELGEPGIRYCYILMENGSYFVQLSQRSRHQVECVFFIAGLRNLNLSKSNRMPSSRRGPLTLRSCFVPGKVSRRTTPQPPPQACPHARAPRPHGLVAGSSTQTESGTARAGHKRGKRGGRCARSIPPTCARSPIVTRTTSRNYSTTILFFNSFI